MLKVENSKDIEKYINTLSSEIVQANIYLNYWIKVKKEVKKDRLTFTTYNTFWGYVLRGYFLSGLTFLYKFYELSEKSTNLNILNLLKTLRLNKEYFGKEYFLNRNPRRSQYKNLVDSRIIPSIESINADINKIKNNSKIRNLIRWRNNALAHLSAKSIIQDIDIFQDSPLSGVDLITLSEEGLELINKYSDLYNALTSTNKPIGFEDIENLLYVLRKDRILKELEVHKEIMSFRKSR
ncbi:MULTISPECIES: hypothetical protein [Leptospira]|uniref:AbiU2 domain-containing protein n=1 Tax=Leptospira TaxID=171 RepID=UPI001EE87700|nr:MULTISPECIES: hypothetical protein [Leptospira]MCG6162000.1 hypothetical protein [Leptospira bandrabouensis]MCG6170149.1 hypothetical protein [Leptospira sanjuanensis]MCG6170183.1 hypothetical protein [Leptospira sanjuanensis]MCG6195485.1 hypothetical protein [Leptospira sanjuanensis]